MPPFILPLVTLLLMSAAGEPCLGIRPGGLFHGEDGTDCTTGFLFTSGSHVYATTAGHCVTGVGQSIWWFYPDAENATSSYVEMEKRAADGRVVAYVVPDHDAAPYPSHHDIAIIQVDARQFVDGAACGWPGPRGIADSNELRNGDEARWFGHGWLFHTTQEQRQGLFVSPADPRTIEIAGPAVVGDSGSAVLTAEGRAAGMLVYSDLTPEHNGTAIGPSLNQIIAFGRESGLELSLLKEGDPIPFPEGPGHPPADGSRANTANIGAAGTFAALALAAVTLLRPRAPGR